MDIAEVMAQLVIFIILEAYMICIFCRINGEGREVIREYWFGSKQNDWF